MFCCSFFRALAQPYKTLQMAQIAPHSTSYYQGQDKTANQLEINEKNVLVLSSGKSAKTASCMQMVLFCCCCLQKSNMLCYDWSNPSLPNLRRGGRGASQTSAY